MNKIRLKLNNFYFYFLKFYNSNKIFLKINKAGLCFT